MVSPELVYTIENPIASQSDLRNRAIPHQVCLLDFPAALDIQIQ
jgi:hypothetical protein